MNESTFHREDLAKSLIGRLVACADREPFTGPE